MNNVNEIIDSKINRSYLLVANRFLKREIVESCINKNAGVVDVHKLY
jgi:hypothetical protein